MFAVMGITGNVGGTIADTLLQHGKKVRGIVRDAAKARPWQDKGVEIFVSNYDENLSEAFSGIEGVFVMIRPTCSRNLAFRIASPRLPPSRRPSSPPNRPGPSFFLPGAVSNLHV